MDHGGKNPEALPVSRAAAALLTGGVTVFPTDTVYGLGVLPWYPQGVRKIYEMKGRPLEKRLGLYFSSPEAILEWVEADDFEARILMTHLPGPYTFILRAAQPSPKPLAEGFFGDTLGVRCPDHPACLALIAECGGVMAGTSANLAGRPEARSVEEIEPSILALADAVVDTGPAALGMASTVVDLPGRKVLRQGAGRFTFP